MVSLDRPMPFPMNLKYRGVWDYEGLYQLMVQWFEDQGYEFHERVFKHKVPSPLGFEQELGWYGWRKVNAYVKFWIYVYWHVWDIKEVEVVKDGKKKKMVQARLFIEFSGKVELDWQNMFTGSKFVVAIQDWMNKYVLHKTITGGWEDELYYRIHKLFYSCKEFLNMETVHNASAHRY
ncbi:MAG: hypothetical protein QF632_01315 [Candidatus Woesearchaeota archaeon]|jgi:hypothetical protein|nr:hypothetical protein [Candidatus Woesearchaeota archaeon]MDP7458028.1 hypothetical protein [Candidatus Woesearchaeota archaeon]